MRIRPLAAVVVTSAIIAGCGRALPTVPVSTTASARAVARQVSTDVVHPSAHPVKLTKATRPLKVSYTYGGKQYTLQDYLTRAKVNGFVVLDGQKIVAERYLQADRNTRFQSWSVAKSFTSAAVGIALKEGYIRSIDDQVVRYLPELRGSGYAGVSIRNLLRMSSGIDWDEKTDAIRLQLAAAAGRPLSTIAAQQVRAKKPGTVFNYTSLNSYVLSMLIHRATKMPYYSYVESRIWKPAGMASTVRLGNDRNGESLGYCCYLATARDFARFGLLYLHGGKAHGRQVVPGSWVNLSTRPSSSFNKNYGLNWWLGGGGQRDFMAAGFGGQYIYVSPKKGVVIVTTSIRGGLTGHQLQGETMTAFRAIAAEVAKSR
jgi:CubicO group peptidase (beta-lactamase class C family)